MKVWGTEVEGYQDVSVFGDDWEDIKYEFDKFIEGLKDSGECCIDAYRIAEALDSNAMEIFGTVLTSCCGSSEIGKEVNGTLYMFGANFGH